MIGDLLDGPGRLVMSRPLAKKGEGEDEPVGLQPIGGLGEILRHEKLPDGRYMVWILGLGRVRITEVASDRLYRQVQCALFPEVEVPTDEVAELAKELRDATSLRLKEPLELPPEAPPALLADLLLQTIGASNLVLERAFAEPSVLARARYVLRAAKRQAKKLASDGEAESAD
jgi:Lon protease-like protein